MQKLLKLLENCLLIQIAAYCTVGMLVSAFDLSANMGRLFVALLAATLLIAGSEALYGWHGILVMTAPAFVLFVRYFTDVSEEFKWVVYSITLCYSEWTPIPVLFSEDAKQMYVQMLAPDTTFAFAAIGVLLIYFLTIAISIKRSTLFTVASTLPLVLLTFVLTNTQADVGYLMGLVAVYLALLVYGAMTYGSDSRVFGFRQNAILPLVLSAVFVSAVYIASPPERYVRSEYMRTINYHIQVIAERIENVIFRLPGEAVGTTNGWFQTSGSGAWMFATGTVAIADAGRRDITDKSLLEIYVSEPGTFYIKGFSVRYYDGRSWKSGTGIPEGLGDFEVVTREMPAAIATVYLDMFAEEPGDEMPPLPVAAGMTVNRISDITNVSYRPYYLSTRPVRDESAIAFLTDYDMLFYYVPGSVHEYAVNEEVMRAAARYNYPSVTLSQGAELSYKTYADYYTQIDETTKEALRQIAYESGIDPNAPRTQIVDAVGAYTRSAGIYSINPPTVPEGEDFVLYFLQTSNQGYCIHFATAATMMLRALDIPARFTNGYVATVSRAQASADGPVILTDRHAHAWVEVLYEDAGWLPLEVTPSSGGSQIPTPEPHTPVQRQQNETPEQLPSPSPNVAPDMPERGAGIGANGNVQPKQEMNALTAAIIRIVGTIAILFVTLTTRRYILKAVRNKLFMQEDANKAVISMWRYVVKMSRRQAIPPTDIEELALEARFSNHRITEEKRDYMLAYTRRLALELYTGKGELGRFWFRYIRGFA